MVLILIDCIDALRVGHRAGFSGLKFGFTVHLKILWVVVSKLLSLLLFIVYLCKFILLGTFFSGPQLVLLKVRLLYGLPIHQTSLYWSGLLLCTMLKFSLEGSKSTQLRVGSMIPCWMLRSYLPKGHSILLISMQLTSQAITRFEQDRKKNQICALHIIVVV